MIKKWLGRRKKKKTNPDHRRKFLIEIVPAMVAVPVVGKSLFEATVATGSNIAVVPKEKPCDGVTLTEHGNTQIWTELASEIGKPPVTNIDEAMEVLRAFEADWKGRNDLANRLPLRSSFTIGDPKPYHVGWDSVDLRPAPEESCPALPPTIKNPGNVEAQLGDEFSLDFFAWNPHMDRMTCTASGLPPGIVFNSITNDLTGTPTVAGVFTPTITATTENEECGLESSEVFSFVVSEKEVSPPRYIMHVGRPMSISVEPNMLAHNLPFGMVMDCSSGCITGTPTRQGLWEISLISLNTGEYSVIDIEVYE